MILHQDKRIDTDSAYPVGGLLPYAGVNTPNGWLKCDGAAYDQADYPELFAVIGTLYNTTAGPGSFNVPDLRERFIEGSDNGDYETGKMISPSIPQHSHSFTGTAATSSSSGSHTHSGGTMDITGQFGVRWGDVNGTYVPLYMKGTSGVFSQGEAESAVSVSTNFSYTSGTAAPNVNFNASNTWSGSSSSVGDHSHTFTAKGTIGKAGDSLSIYKGTTVQPKSVAMNYIIKC